jgi:uncharacterized membrane protein
MVSFRTSKPAAYAGLFGIILLGAFLRLYRINYQSTWVDEDKSLIVSQTPLARMIYYFKSDRPQSPSPRQTSPNSQVQPLVPGLGETNTPLYYLTLHLWFYLFGFGPLQARLLSAMAGILCLPMLFFVAKQLYDTRTGLISALLLAVSQLGIRYSQEARPYALFLLLFLATLLFFLISTSRRSAFAWCCCTVCGVLMVGTHYFGAFAIVALSAYMVLYWRARSVPLPWIGGAAAAGLVTLLPWLIYVLAGQVHLVTASPQPPWLALNRWTAIIIVSRFNNGAVWGFYGWPPRWAYGAVGLSLLLTGPALVMAWRWLRKGKDAAGDCERSATSFALILWLLPLLMIVALGFLNIPFDVRYVAFCIAPYYILTAAGICRLQSMPLKVVVVTVILGYSVGALRANYFIPYKENYRDAVSYISQRHAEDDCYAFVPFGNPPWCWPIYTSVVPARRIVPGQDEPWRADCRRIWVVSYKRVSDVPPPQWQELLQKLRANCQKTEDQQFFWVGVELYTSCRLKFSQ